MARRSSARLRGRNSSTPKRVSLSHDAPLHTPRTVPAKLSSLQENDEMPGAFPNSASPAPRRSIDESKQTTKIPMNFGATTPKHNTPIRPTAEEMHPEKHHQSTAKPMEEARWLGFANMAPHTEPPKHASRIATLQGTPTRSTSTRKPTADSPKIQFSFQREQSLELSPAAKKLMSEKREEAAKIREQMIASGANAEDAAAAGRRIATPRGKKGRFSEVHLEEFKKMDSIASHPSAMRAATHKTSANGTPIRVQTESQKVQATPSPVKSLKRSPSKAQLDEPLPKQQQLSLPRSSSKPTFLPHGAPSSTSKEEKSAPDDSSSPAKRVKRYEAQDVSIARPSSKQSDKPNPSTPTATAKATKHVNFSNIASPTQSSLSRNASVKTTNTSKIPGPQLTRSPSKPQLQDNSTQSTQLVRSPSKPELQDNTTQSTPLLARSPSKACLFSRPTAGASQEAEQPASPLLQRSPLKGSLLKKSSDSNESSGPQISYPALLSQSPKKGSVAKDHSSEGAKEKPAPATPLLARTPAKITMPTERTEEATTKIPTTGSKLLGRFNLLRASPMKSILRSPHRMYSDDPLKVAAGTHLATPPKITSKQGKGSGEGVTSSLQKRVDFSSSTKARYERAQSELSSTPSKGPTPSPKPGREAEESPKPTGLYPELPSQMSTPTVSPQKRRQTATPADFTFRAGQQNIIFSQSPNAPPSAASSKRSSTIRHVSAEPQLPSAPMLAPATTAKKRKFDFENDNAADTEKIVEASDKENAAEEEADRPAKRVKHSEPSPAKPATKPSTRRPTLGVKPKKGEEVPKEKKASTISRARLNALAQPKRKA
ncbi:uncharacterized protein LTR77_002583 [Saxophila tyrrhenica]|uniref:Erythromycin esterase n=1 Tax=Saxophila tyrrhenica TaxID=1690608 RepID=A0AAV9PIY0_9PEZI|nr:hypothetical protein LTR77_002583 [Saxophila tyrrhenica]